MAAIGRIYWQLNSPQQAMLVMRGHTLDTALNGKDQHFEGLRNLSAQVRLTP